MTRAALPLPGSAAPWYPVAGALAGLAGAGLHVAAARVLPVWLAAVLTVGFWILIRGAQPELAFAHAAAGFRTPSLELAGALALLLSVLVRWLALRAIPLADPVHCAFTVAAALAVGPAVIVALAWIVNPADDAPAQNFAVGLTTPRAVLALALAAALALWADPLRGLWMLAAGYAVVLSARWWFTRTLGGVTARSLLAAGHAAEILALLILAWRA